MSEGNDNTTLLVALIGGIATVVTGIIAFFGGQNHREAQLTNALTQGFRDLTNELQEERATDRKRILQLEGEVAGLQQWAQSLEKLLRDHDIPIPERRPVGTVFFLTSNEGQH